MDEGRIVEKLDSGCPVDGIFGATAQSLTGRDCEPSTQSFAAGIEMLVDHPGPWVSGAVSSKVDHAGLDQRE